MNRHGPARVRAFTLLELIVTMGVVALLVSILLPSLSSARGQARRAACGSNLRELGVSNSYYADDSGGMYVPGAAEFRQNRKRWHGERESVGEEFDPARGPLAEYLGPAARVKECPSFPADVVAAESGGFERGCGGYGYNNRYIGVQLARLTRDEYIVADDRGGAYVSDVTRPGDTIMFADTAFAESGLFEYSFAEPRFHPRYAGQRAVPSIHFRHMGQANVVWCDGHVDAHRMTMSHKSPFYASNPADFKIGWFGESDDNRLFDLD